MISFGLNNIKQEKQAIPEKEKQKALFKVDLITSWQEYRNSAKNKAVADKEFIDLYNSQLLNTGIYKKIGKTSLKTLYRWHKQWIESERDWKSLTNSYNFCIFLSIIIISSAQLSIEFSKLSGISLCNLYLSL